MFVQLGFSYSLSTFCVGLLFLPTVLTPIFRKFVLRTHNLKFNIHVSEILVFLCLVMLALYLNSTRTSHLELFSYTLALSFLRTWHSSLTKRYYECKFVPLKQKIYSKTRAFSSQLVIILTYGIIIILVGFLEIFFRDFSKAWAMGCYFISGIYLFFVVVNVIAIKGLKRSEMNQPEYKEKRWKSSRLERGVDSMSQFLSIMLSMFMILLPQALMFNTRVFYLLAPVEQEGLNCSLQDVGFAHGTVGVVAFTIGLFLGRGLIRKYHLSRVFTPMAVVLTLSPMSYMIMTECPHPESLLAICMMTFFAQWCFGFGLNVCGAYIRYISNEQYKNIANYLFTPLVSAMLVIPSMLSGWMAESMDFKTFFTVNTACAIAAWIVLWACNIHKKLFALSYYAFSGKRDSKAHIYETKSGQIQ